MATLQEIFTRDWAADKPRNLVELVHADYDNLDDVEKALRKMAMDLVHSFERSPVMTARAALELIEKHHLPVRKGYWLAVALDAKRERVYTQREGGGLRLLHAVSKRFPRPETLNEKAPLPAGGTYLLIHGGGTDALDDDALCAYRTLTTGCHVADVLLWETTDASATFWSVKAGKGRRGSEILEFPDNELLRRWQTG